MTEIAEWWMWPSFLVFMAIMLAIDIFLLGGKKAHRVSNREALVWSFVWFFLALAFNALLWWYLKQHHGLSIANEKAVQFFTGYLIEKSLSIDNVFVFYMIFSYFAIAQHYQRLVLLYGVLGAIMLRLIFIVLGIWLIQHFHWLLYIFGLFLIFAAIKMFSFSEKKMDIAANPILIWMRRHLRITENLEGEHIFVRQNKLLYVTPLFLVLVLIEGCDLVFALDSIPAIFAITNDPFIVFTSNIFAIMGLRSLYFLLANMADRFHYLKYGLALILFVVGAKMLLSYYFEISTVLSLALVVIILAVSVVASLLAPKHP